MKLYKIIVALVATIALILGILSISSCEINGVEVETIQGASSMFIEIESGPYWYVVYHRETRVMYAVSAGSKNYGAFTVLVNGDGTPMRYVG